MSTIYDETHELFRKSFRAFVDGEMLPHYRDWESAGIMDRVVYAEAGRHGFIGMAIPEEFGGGGTADFRFNAIIAEELAAVGVASRPLLPTGADVNVHWYVSGSPSGSFEALPSRRTRTPTPGTV